MPILQTARHDAPLPASAAPPRRGLLRAGLAVLTVWMSALSPASGQQALSDQQMKAAYVLNFIRYMDWPERTFAAQDTPIVVCVPGDPGVSMLAGIAGKTVKGRPIQIRAASSVDEARTCQVLFLPETEVRRYFGILRALQNAPVLTISDAEAFIDIGGMIGLVHLDNRLQFEVHLGVVQQAHLKASSQLLRLARNVIEARPR